MSQDLTTDDHALLTALAVLDVDLADPAAAGLPPLLPAGDPSETANTLTRLYHEALGLIPSSLPPLAPSLALKHRIMASIAVQAPAAAITAPALPAAAPAPAESAASTESLPAPAPVVAIATRQRAAGAWKWLAAASVLLLLGVSGWLLREVGDRGAALARLGNDRAAALRRTAEVEARLRHLEVEAGHMRQGFGVVTSPAVEVCALRPNAAMPAVAGAHGILFVAADHQHWYMSLRGLQPAGAGKVYQLWFIGQQGPVSAGTFRGDPLSSWEQGSESMPAGTREVRITVEDGAGSPAPTGPEVFHNTDLFRVL